MLTRSKSMYRTGGASAARGSRQEVDAPGALALRDGVVARAQPAHELHVAHHDGHALRVDRAQVRVLEVAYAQAQQSSRRLHYIRFVIVSNYCSYQG